MGAQMLSNINTSNNMDRALDKIIERRKGQNKLILLFNLNII